MKKSFKKAGAAVLSMSMLLAMGASAMPVYAVDAPGTAGKSTNDIVNPYTGTGTSTVGSSTLPGSVYISLSNNLLYHQGEGTDANGANGGVDEGRAGTTSDPYHYQYLPAGTKITDAQVNIYKVAELDGDHGWQWNGLSTQQISDINNLLSTTVKDEQGNTVADPTAFQKLLEKISDSNRTDNGEFATKSEELQKVASYLERNKASLTGGSIATGTINEHNQTIGFTLPEIDPALMTTGYTNDTAPKTLNKIGYYLITTTTEQAGVLVQPVLISLKNGPENPKNISLKGSTIDIAKRITHVGTEDEKTGDSDAEGTDGIKENHDTYLYEKGEGDAKRGGLRATVGKEDVVHYEISAQLPQYDAGVDLATAQDFIIHDYATNGITVDLSTVKVYLSQADESKAGTIRSDTTSADNWYLKKGANLYEGDYYVARRTGDPHGFDLTISVAQMRGKTKGTGTYTGSITKPESAPADKYASGYNEGELKTMENAFIIVSFDAVVDKKADGSDIEKDADIAFRRSYVNPITYGTTGGITYNADSGADATENAAFLDTIYANWVAYVNKEGTGTYNKGVEEAVLNAKAAGTYNDYLSNTTLQSAAGGVTGMYDGYTTADTIKEYHPTTPFADAAEKTAFIEAEQTKEKVIAMLLAIDHYNSTRNGETNYADMVYGNNYSTGGDKAKVITNDTTLYSVNMNLNKFVEKLTLTHVDSADVKNENLGTYVTWADIVTEAAKSNYSTVTDAPDGSPTWDQVKALTDTATANGVDNADKPKYQAAAAALLAAAKGKLEANKNYSESWIKEAVKDAVFKLTDPDGETYYAASLGTNESDNSKSGILVKLTASTGQTSIPTADDGAIYYEEVTGESGKTYTWYTLPAAADQENAWVMLQQGTYTLEEVKAPTGFKKWAKPVSIQINALNDQFADVNTASTHKTPDGAYEAKGWSEVSTEIASKQDEAGIGDSNTNAVTFAYYDTGKNQQKSTNGVLTHDIYNEYQDTLPATGGIGTVLFTAGGISVVLIAGALFVMYMKKRNSEEEE